MHNSGTSYLLMHDNQYLAFQEQIQDAQIDESEILPDAFTDFWQDWFRLSQQNCNDFFQLLQILERLLFQSADELLTHELSSALCKALRFWQLQIQRYNEGENQTDRFLHFPNASQIPKHNPQKVNRTDTAVRVSLKVLIHTWEKFLQKFIPQLNHHRSIIMKAIAVPYSFSGLAIIQGIDKEILQQDSSLSPYSSIHSNISKQNSRNIQDSAIQHSWGVDLLTAKFQKTIGKLPQAEQLLQSLIHTLQPNVHNATFSAVTFELCDIYQQMEQDKLFRQHIRHLVLQNPANWDFTLVGGQFCSQLLNKLPHRIRNHFHSNDPVALNWAGLYALAAGEYGPGDTLNRQMQKAYWAQILQLKKSISDQKLSVKQHESQKNLGLLKEKNPASSHQTRQSTNIEFYTLQRAQLLVYYILILEHLNWVRKSESSRQVLEENSALWQNVMIEIYSLSEDISQRCRNRFS